MKRIERGGRQGWLASEDRCLAKGSGESSRLKRRRAWGVCGRGGRSGGFREEYLTKGAVQRNKGLVYGLLAVLWVELRLIDLFQDETYSGLFLGVLVIHDGRAGDRNFLFCSSWSARLGSFVIFSRATRRFGPGVIHDSCGALARGCHCVPELEAGGMLKRGYFPISRIWIERLLIGSDHKGTCCIKWIGWMALFVWT